MAPAIRDSRSLNSIDVGYNDIGQAAALELLTAMKGKDMVSIGMASCQLGVEGAKVVAEIVAVSRSLTQVPAFLFAYVRVLAYCALCTPYRSILREITSVATILLVKYL